MTDDIIKTLHDKAMKKLEVAHNQALESIALQHNHALERLRHQPFATPVFDVGDWLDDIVAGSRKSLDKIGNTLGMPVFRELAPNTPKVEPIVLPPRIKQRFSPEVIEHIVNRAMSALGLPYVTAGGNENGPTDGVERGEVGFDCSGLVVYAYGDRLSLPRWTGAMIHSPNLYEVVNAERQRGNLLFSNYDSDGVPGHVSLYLGDNQVIEAGDPVGRYSFTEADRGFFKTYRVVL